MGTCLELGDPGVNLGEDEGEEEEGLNREVDSEGDGGEGGYEDSLGLSGDVESDVGRFVLLGERE